MSKFLDWGNNIYKRMFSRKRLVGIGMFLTIFLIIFVGFPGLWYTISYNKKTGVEFSLKKSLIGRKFNPDKVEDIDPTDDIGNISKLTNDVNLTDYLGFYIANALIMAAIMTVFIYIITNESRLAKHKFILEQDAVSSDDSENIKNEPNRIKTGLWVFAFLLPLTFLAVPNFWVDISPASKNEVLDEEQKKKALEEYKKRGILSRIFSGDKLRKNTHVTVFINFLFALMFSVGIMIMLGGLIYLVKGAKTVSLLRDLAADISSPGERKHLVRGSKYVEKE